MYQLVDYVVAAQPTPIEEVAHHIFHVRIFRFTTHKTYVVLIPVHINPICAIVQNPKDTLVLPYFPVLPAGPPVLKTPSEFTLNCPNAINGQTTNITTIASIILAFLKKLFLYMIIYFLNLTIFLLLFYFTLPLMIPVRVVAIVHIRYKF